jgi:hypothetical protein
VPVVAADDAARDALLRDIVRVGAEAIVSFPNFAYWPHRVACCRAACRCPSAALPVVRHAQRALRHHHDFKDLAVECGLEVLEYVALAEGRRSTSCPTCAAAWPCSGCGKKSLKGSALMACRQQKRGWLSLPEPPHVSILFLGFSSGLPLYTLIYLMQAWLAKSGWTSRRWACSRW